MRIVVLGAGFGGLELARLLSAEFGADAGVVLIDKADAFVFGFSKLDVMFGRTTAGHVRHRYADVAMPGSGSCRRRSAHWTRWPGGSGRTARRSRPTS